MPELAIARDRNLNLRPFQPLVLDNRIAQQTFTPDLREAIEGNAKAANIGAIGQAIAGIPDLILNSYEKGRKLRQQGAQDKLVNDAISGQGSNTLASLGYKGDGKGGYTLNPGAHTGSGGALQHQIDQNLKEKGALDRAFNSNTGVVPSSAPAVEPALPTDAVDTTDVPTGSDLGIVTDYGYEKPGEPYYDSNSGNGIGAWDNKLEPGVSLAVSPDIQQQFKAQGIPQGGMVNLQLSNGKTVPVRWDDKTSAKLNGRFDIYSPSGPSPLRDARVVGFSPLVNNAQDGPMVIDGHGPLPQETQGVSPAIQSQAQAAAVNAGNQLTQIAPEDLSASAQPGPIPVAPVTGAQPTPEVQGPLANLPLAAKGATITPGRPLEGFDPTLPYGDTKGVPVAPVAPQAFDPSKPVSRPTIGKSPVTGNTLYSPTPGNLIEYNAEGGKTALKPDTSYLAAQKAIDAKAKLQPIPAMLRSEAARMGIPVDGKSIDEVTKAMEEKQIETGVIPPHLLPVAQSMSRLIIGHPALKHLPTIREAKEAVDAGLANPDAGGFSDMALIEGFQRMVNPGATVRTQTMQNMKEAAGWLQQLDPRFQWEKATSGDKFTPEARQRLHKLADDIYERSLKNAVPQLNALKKNAKAYGISNPDAFVDNVLTLSPLYDTGGAEVPVVPTGQTPQPAAPASPMTGGPAASVQATTKVKMRSPDGSEAYVNPDAVEKYKAKGATIVQ